MHLKNQIKYYLLVFFLFLSICPLQANDNIPQWKKDHMPEGDDWKATKQHYIFNNGSEPKSLDPTVITGLLEFRLVNALFEGLTSADPKTLEPRPGVAKSWEIKDNSTTYLFHLRKDAKWNNNEALTATDFLLSWQRALTPGNEVPYNYMLFPIKNAKGFAEGKITDFTQVGIKALNAHLLEVKLEAPCSYFLDLTAFPTLYPVPVKLVNKFGNRWINLDHIVSNGPYQLATWKPREILTMVKNKNYWDTKFCKLEKITALPYDDVETAYKLFLNNKIHWLPGVPVGKVDEAKQKSEYYVAENLSTYFYRFNVTKAPFDDVRVRKALSMGFDREVITKKITKGGQTPATWFCPPAGSYKTPKGLGHPYNKTKARKLLAEAGYGANGKPFPTTTLLFNSSEKHKKIAEAIAEQWKVNLGIKVLLKNTEWKIYLEDTNKLKFEISRGGWTGDYNDPNTFFDMWATGNGNNRTGWSNKEYDTLLNKANLETDIPTRMNLFQKMERILVEEEMPIIPIYIDVSEGMLHESVEGFYENNLNQHPVKYIWLED